MSDLPQSRNGRSLLEVAELAARRAGEIIRENFLEELSLQYKGTGGAGNIVTHVDLAAEKAALDIILNEYPDHNVLSEEAGHSEQGAFYTWVLDPLDGTLNYSYGLNFFATSIALLAGEEPIAGIIYDPTRDEMFMAAEGQGASLNGTPIRVSSKDALGASLALFDLGYQEERRKIVFETAARLRPHVQGLRLMGSAALSLAYVACGRADLYFHAYLYPWDVAAAIVLIREAGGMITDWNGRPSAAKTSSVVAAPPALHRTFLRLVADRKLGSA